MDYNFKNFFKVISIQYGEYVSNGHILIKKSCLKKPQLDLTKDFPQATEQQAKVFEEILKREGKKEIIKDFSPIFIKEVTQKKPVLETYNIVISEIDIDKEGNSNHTAIKEKYYNFIQDIKCSVKVVNENQFSPLMIYNTNNEIVGVAMPCSMINVLISECQDYKKHLSNLQTAKKNKDIEAKNKVNNIKQ